MNTEASRYWRVEGLAGVSCFSARFERHSYSRHTHDEYAVGTIESGVQTFHCRGGQRLSLPGSVILVNPDDLHDGRSADGAYRYRMIYLDPAVVSEALRDAGESHDSLPLFRTPVVRDEELAAWLCAFNRRTETPEGPDTLELESRLLHGLRALLSRHAAGTLRRSPHDGNGCTAVRYARQVLDEQFAADLSLGQLAAHCGMSRFALLRLFTREVGMPPHAYMTRARLREARRLLLAGEAPASVAAAVGYVDQSHLTKRFRAAFGITPGQFTAGRP
ncbi:AraC family transcriptional regulator [Schlegelella sp. S2-27]|uniref:AraC family transcriptional regulator n=1 Tax=Caldimonas mangrovi TaxID=2944811 RepID=A0ABT0YSV3_9BURK|nr:AraC family transcriptional regulator [Caldimonas mangrovi]